MATIYDIASKAQLSAATVSRVLSGKRTSEENRRKVLAVARELNYHNLALAEAAYQQLGQEKDTQRSIILLPGRTGSEGVYTAARELGYNIILVSSIEHSKEYVRHLLSSKVASGALIHSTAGEVAFWEELAQEYPVVTVGVSSKNCVWIDPDATFTQLMRELLAQGCRRIWCCNSVGPDRDLPLLRARRAIEQYGEPDCALEFHDLTAANFSQAFADHVSFVEQILSLPMDKRPDGLLMHNSVIASCVVSMLRSRGVRIPDDIRIVSAIGGDHDFACEPYLTSILPPYYELGYEGMKMLDQLISGRTVAQEIRYPHKLRFGGSSRPELAPFEMISE